MHASLARGLADRSPQKVGGGESSLLILLILCLCGAESPLKKTGLYAAEAGFESNVFGGSP
jgi:hypothetical protein